MHNPQADFFLLAIDYIWLLHLTEWYIHGRHSQLANKNSITELEALNWVHITFWSTSLTPLTGGKNPVISSTKKVGKHTYNPLVTKSSWDIIPLHEEQKANIKTKKWPTLLRTPRIVLISWFLSEQSLCSLASRVTVCHLEWSSTRSWSLRRLSMALHIVGWTWPTSFIDIVGSRASSQGDIVDIPDWRLIGRWHLVHMYRWVYTIVVDQELNPIAALGLLIF